MKGTKELHTERLLLRRYHLEDAETMHIKFGTDPQMYAYSGWNPYATMEMARESVQRFIESYADTDFYGWAIDYLNNLIGTAGAYDYDAEKNQIEVGFSIAKECWGKGFATEALVCVLQYLTEQEGIKTVTAWCAKDNDASKKVLLKSGMKQTGINIDGLQVDGKVYDQLFFSYSAE